MQPSKHLSSACLTLSLLLAAPVGAQEPVDLDMIQQIRAEGLERSEIPSLFHHLIDVVGQRLAGSPGYNEAATWAQGRFAEWGLANARLEHFEFGRGWSVEKATFEMTAPRYMPLIAYPEGWAPSLDGVVEREVLYLGGMSMEEVDALGDRLRGAIVMAHQPQTEFRTEDRPQPAGEELSVRTGNPPGIGSNSTLSTRELVPRLEAAGAALLIEPGIHFHGTVMVHGNRNAEDDDLPQVVMAPEQYNMIARLSESGIPVRLRAELRTRYHEDDTRTANVIAEIPGTDPELADEIVLIGGHLDSWHTSNGATDNGDGSVAAMEAMRILAAVGARPRRTIQVALWAGEEQGLLGARAYIEQHLGDQAARDRISTFLNDDPGSGATFGFYMQENEAAKAIFDAWLEPLADLGMRRNVIEGIGSTDHVPFNQIGVPAFTAIKDFTGYDSRGRHTNQDFLERVSYEDLAQSAVVLATFAWHAAQRDEVIPRAPEGP